MRSLLAVFYILVTGPIWAFAQSVAVPLVTPEATPAPAAAPIPAPTEPTTAAAAPQTLTLQLPKMVWSGDLRYRLVKRHEAIDEDRRLTQLRARLGVRAEVNEDVDAVIRLATATSAISANQTLGDSSDPGSARRSFGLDLAYIDWKFLGAGDAWVGRVANPFWSPAKIQTVFDADLAFEGVAGKWNQKFRRSNLFANIGGFIISENYAAPNDIVDTGLLGAQVGYSFTQGPWTGTLHVATYRFTNIKDRPITALDKNAGLDVYSTPFETYMGNSVYVEDPLVVVADRRYLFTYQYNLQEIGTEQKVQWGPFDGIFFADLVRNDETQTQNKAYEYGLGLKWRWLTVSEAVVKKAADAVVAAFTDSDTNGGGTDNKGRRFMIAAQLGKNASATVTVFRGDRGVSRVSREYRATFLDFQVNF